MCDLGSLPLDGHSHMCHLNVSNSFSHMTILKYCPVPLRSFSMSVSSEEELDEWQPPEPKVPRKTTKDSGPGKEKSAAKRTTKPKEPKPPKPPKEPKPPKPPKEPKPKKPPKEPKPGALRKTSAKASTSTLGPGSKRKHADSVEEAVKQSCGEDGGVQSGLPGGGAEGGQPGAMVKVKVEVSSMWIGTLRHGI